MTKSVIEQALDNRIRWIRKILEGKLSTDRSNEFQWLLNHLITIQEGKNIEDFTSKEAGK